MCPARVAAPRVHTMTNHGLASSAEQGPSEHISWPKRHSVLAAQIFINWWKTGKPRKASSEENTEKPLSEKAF